MRELVGTLALRAPATDVELSDSVRVAAADGLVPYTFNTTNVPAEFTHKIQKLNKFLFDVAVKYIKQQTSRAGVEFDFNFQYLNHEFPDYRKTISYALWNVRMPEKQNASDMDIMCKMRDADNTK